MVKIDSISRIARRGDQRSFCGNTMTPACEGVIPHSRVQSIHASWRSKKSRSL